MYLGEHNNLVNEFFAFRNQTLIICVTALFTNGEAFTLWSFLLNSTIFVKEKIDSINNLSVTELKYCLMYWSNIPKKKWKYSLPQQEGSSLVFISLSCVVG